MIYAKYRYTLSLLLKDCYRLINVFIDLNLIMKQMLGRPNAGSHIRVLI